MTDRSWLNMSSTPVALASTWRSRPSDGAS